MNFLRNLFGGGQGGESGDRDGMYFYIRANRSKEVIKVRINRVNDLSLMDDMQTYYVRKVIVGQQSFERIEAEFTFNKNRQLLGAEISGGELVEREDYDVYVAS